MAHLMNIMFIFDRCRRSSAAVTPAKYESYSVSSTYTLAKAEICLIEN